MKRLKALYPRLILVVAGVALGLLARQVLGPPEEGTGPALAIERPIAEGLDLETAGDVYVPVDLPIEPLKPVDEPGR